MSRMLFSPGRYIQGAGAIRQVAEAATAAGETIHATWFPVTAAMVEAAIWTADALGVNYKKA